MTEEMIDPYVRLQIDGTPWDYRPGAVNLIAEPAEPSSLVIWLFMSLAFGLGVCVGILARVHG